MTLVPIRKISAFDTYLRTHYFSAKCFFKAFLNRFFTSTFIVHSFCACDQSWSKLSFQSKVFLLVDRNGYREVCFYILLIDAMIGGSEILKDTFYKDVGVKFSHLRGSILEFMVVSEEQIGESK